MTKDISTAMTSGVAIIIGNGDVELDLGGHTIGDLAAGAGTAAVGISAQGVVNVTIRNGTIRGFQTAINMYSSPGALVENIRADSNTLLGITVSGAGSVVRHNQVLKTGGTTYAGGGIQIGGDGSRVLDNDVVQTLSNGSSAAFGIGICSGNGIVAELNRVSNSTLSGGYTYGIQTCASTNANDALIVNNRITRMHEGVTFFSLTGAYRDNLTIGVATPYTGGTNQGNNQ